MSTFVRSQRLQNSNGVIVNTLLDGLEDSTADLWVGTKLPDVKMARMVTVRNDGGLIVGRVAGSGQGINVWADDELDALNLALDCMTICQRDLPGARVDESGPVIIAATREFSGPFEVNDDVPYIVDDKTLTHYYFAFTADTKAVAV
jgi:hypothetical protein